MESGAKIAVESRQSHGTIDYLVGRWHQVKTDWADLPWPDSILFDVTLSLLVGIGYALLLLGPVPLNPTNVSWVKGDLATYYIGWASLSQTPDWHWPLTYTDRLGFPVGDAVADMDINSLAALLLKPFVKFLPSPFQYLGLWAILSMAAQFYFGVRLMRLFLGRRLWPLLCGGLLLTISPVMTWRFLGHFALTNQWPILAALYLYFGWQRGLLKLGGKLGAAWCGLAAITVAINPYIALCVVGVLGAACLRAILIRFSRWYVMIAIGALAGCSLICSGYAIGLIQLGSGLTGGGYKIYSMNLLAPINSDGRALLLPKLPYVQNQEMETYNYLGLGVLVLIAILVVNKLIRKQRIRWHLREVTPLLTMSVVFTALALSTRVTIGSHVLFDIDPRDWLTPYLGMFRGSGRLFWLPYYLITVGAVVLLFKTLPKKTAALVGIGVLIVQFADEAPLRNWVKTVMVSPSPEVLHSPVWNHLSEKHANLLVFPAWQCSPQDTPGGPNGFAIFGLLSMRQHMRTNSYYAARYSPQSSSWHCDESLSELVPRLRQDSAYVLSPSLASALEIVGNKQGSGLCHQVDGFLLCSAATDFGLGPGIKLEAPVLSGNALSLGVSNPAASKFLVWGWWATEPWGAWSKGNGILQFRVDSDQAHRFGHVLLKLWLPVGRETGDYTIQNGAATVRGTMPGGSGFRVEAFDVKVPLQPGADGTNTLYLKADKPLRPVDLGASRDSRQLGLGILSLSLTP